MMAETRGPIDINDVNRSYWDAIAANRLIFQRCRHCRNAWLPPRSECPNCLEADWAWNDARGTGRIVSWVVYHTAHDESFKDRVPYNVAIVELDEGPRMVTNIVGVPHDQIEADGKVRFIAEPRGELTVACFTPDSSR
jgi:uncharacterized OB-fold protein